MYFLVKIILFLFPPEEVHYFTMNLLRFIHRYKVGKIFFRQFRLKNETHVIQAMGLEFKHPVGLAAGFDKNAEYIDVLSDLGFSFIEVGTVTPKPQDGNLKPRLFRLNLDNALINRMGFNNKGVEAMKNALEMKRSDTIIGINIGKNKSTPNNLAYEDYLFCFKELYHFADYFVVNVSSPNTPDLRKLQSSENIQYIMNQLAQERNRLMEVGKKYIPILIKLSPDMDTAELKHTVEAILETPCDGMVLTNTSISRVGLNTNNKLIEKMGLGGLSGKPIKIAADATLKYVANLTKHKDKFTLIGVGGIMNSEDALVKKEYGANLVQLYSGLIYKGPKLIKTIAKSWEN